MKVVFSLLFLITVIVCAQLNAGPKYQQEVTLSCFTSLEDCKQQATEFLRATLGDPHIQIIGIRYQEEKWGENLTAYQAIVTCHVSDPDRDIIRMKDKMMKNNPNLKSD